MTPVSSSEKIKVKFWWFWHFEKIRAIYQLSFNSSYSILFTASEAGKALIDGQTQKGLGADRPLLHNTYMVERSVTNLKQLMMDLPAYADQFLNMICNILQEYKETCQATYRGEFVKYDQSLTMIVCPSFTIPCL